MGVVRSSSCWVHRPAHHPPFGGVGVLMRGGPTTSSCWVAHHVAVAASCSAVGERWTVDLGKHLAGHLLLRTWVRPSHPCRLLHVAASSVVAVHCWDDRPVGHNFASGVGGRWKVDHRWKVGRQNFLCFVVGNHSAAASYCSVVDLFVASVVVHYCSWIVGQVGHCNPLACRSCPVVALGCMMFYFCCCGVHTCRLCQNEVMWGSASLKFQAANFEFLRFL